MIAAGVAISTMAVVLVLVNCVLAAFGRL